MFSYQQQYAWVRWGQVRSDTFPIGNGTRQGSIASPVFWAVYCDLLIKELRQLGVGANIAGVFMIAAAYADDLVLVAPTRHAILQIVAVYEDYAERNNVLFRTHQKPQLSKTKCIFMIGKSLNLVKPAHLQLCEQNLPWGESANHIGHMLHQSGNMDHGFLLCLPCRTYQSISGRSITAATIGQ